MKKVIGKCFTTKEGEEDANKNVTLIIYLPKLSEYRKDIMGYMLLQSQKYRKRKEYETDRLDKSMTVE